MTDSTVAVAKHATLASNTVDRVTFTGDPGRVEVLNRGTGGPIYFTVGTTDPTVAGDNTYVALAGGSTVVNLGAVDQVRLIAATSTDYTVTGF